MHRSSVISVIAGAAVPDPVLFFAAGAFCGDAAVNGSEARAQEKRKKRRGYMDKNGLSGEINAACVLLFIGPPAPRPSENEPGGEALGNLAGLMQPATLP